MDERPIRVLIVDDNPGIRLLISQLARRGGMSVVGEAADGRQAVEQARRFQPDAVLLDVDMPVMDGITAISPILDAAPSTRVVMFSAHPHLQEDCFAAGAHGWVTKGTTWSEIQRVIRDAIANAGVGRTGDLGHGETSGARRQG